MISIKKRHIHLLLIAALLPLLISTANATAQSFTVHAGETVTRVVTLQVDDHIHISFTVTGQTSSTLDFSISDPNGNIIQRADNTGNFNYDFICTHEGDYQLNFTNTAANEDKLASLDYEIIHYIFGMPQMLFLTLIVAGLCVAAVAVFIGMSKKP